MDVSIIIVNYNTCDLTLQCIQSVYEKTKGISYEIIVVDNASSDNIEVELPKAYPEVLLILSETNLGFGKANNLGYRHAKGDYIFLLNSDTLLVNNAVKKLFDFLNTHPEYAIAGGQLYDNAMNKIHSYKLLLPSILEEVSFLSLRVIYNMKQSCFNRYMRTHDYGRVAYITGADMMINNTYIKKYGLFDPDFFMYFEETELTYRYAQHKLYSAFVKSAKIVHLVGKSFSFKLKREECFHEGKSLYFNKTHCRFYKFLVYILASIGYVLCHVKYSIVLRECNHYEWFFRLKILWKYF